MGARRAPLGVREQPSSAVALEDGAEIWRYSHREQRRSHGKLLLVLRRSHSEVIDHSVFVEFRADEVIKVWRS